MKRSHVPLAIAQARYPYKVAINNPPLAIKADIALWLKNEPLKGSYRIDQNFSWVDGELKNRPIVYMFSDENAAFAFKMRWA